VIRTRRRHRGAALIAAMLTVTLVASLSAAALWQHWQQVEVETAQRQRQQAGAILVGALDWSRLVLREDARDNSVDHLGEPWALPLKEAKLGQFLAADRQSSDPDSILDAFLSGQISDAQAKLNVNNLVDGSRISAPDLQDFSRLFVLLGLPLPELRQAAQNLLAASDKQLSDAERARAAIAPSHWAQLQALGLSAQTLAALQEHATLLPERTKVNLNTASATVLRATLSGLDAADAQRLVTQRETAHFKTIDDARKTVPSLVWAVNESRHSVASQYFEIHGQLRMGQHISQEHSLVKREGTDVRVLWRSSSASLQSGKPTQNP
jgi:general secretion pathway protein K